MNAQVPLFSDDADGALISPCKAYRWRLWRRLRAVPDPRTCVFVMLNPSTADHRQNDPTIRKNLGFATRWGFDRLEVVNLYAFRATQPTMLWRTDDPVGAENDRVIREVVSTYPERVVCAWGAHAGVERARAVYAMIRELGVVPWRLTLTKEGQPGHPLMLSYSIEPVEWIW